VEQDSEEHNSDELCEFDSDSDSDTGALHGEPISTQCIIGLATRHDYHQDLVCKVLPGGDSHNSACTTISSLFHIDVHGNSCFSLQEAQNATKHLVDSNFVNEAQKRINTTSFHFPQQHGNVQHHLCNEQIYASCTFVEMTGLVKLL